MSEETETSPEGDRQRPIAVRRLFPARGTTSHEIIRAVRSTLHGRSIRTISVALVDDATISSLHERYLGDPRPTDVLAFDLRDDSRDQRIEGEIVVSVEAARRSAARLGLHEAREVLRYVIHGTLHLMGYDDCRPADRARMRQAENRVLAGLSPDRRRLKARVKQRRARGGV